MPRFTTESSGARNPEREFDLCARCAAEPEVLRVVAAKKAGVAADVASSVTLVRLPHTSYDFSARPMPCISCARVLGAEDD